MSNEASKGQVPSCRMVHHGAAASSSPHCLVWLPPSSSLQGRPERPHSGGSSSVPSSRIAYASHGIVNLCECKRVRTSSGGSTGEGPQNNKHKSTEEQPVWTVVQTLRTSIAAEDATKRVITSMAHISGVDNDGSLMLMLLVGFSNGSVTLWRCSPSTFHTCWTEQPIVETDTGRSITHLDGRYVKKDKRYVIFTCSSEGTQMIQVDANLSCSFNHRSDMGNINDLPTTRTSTIASFSANVVKVETMPSPPCVDDDEYDDVLLVLIGTAAPRHNRIHVYTLSLASTESVSPSSFAQLHHVGSLAGHEDWITCFAWNCGDNGNSSSTTLRKRLLLASGSQDAKIRLWEFTTATRSLTNDATGDSNVGRIANETIVSDDESDDSLHEDEEDDEEGEARLELIRPGGITRVTLEALLFGHEEAVTAVCWHPKPMELYGQDEILISSSMDRTLLIWSPFTGVWTPLTRVGGAGGILGGSIGSTLLGFVDVVIEPVNGTSLMGHAYGGALHVWSVQQDDESVKSNELSVEEIAMKTKWKAMPCITGHFQGVSDLCWEAEHGDYLLTVSADQTCRLWAPVPALANDQDVWVELARPQVHGYDIAAVTSVSTKAHPHLYVSGADEKEARVFDAPMSTLRLLQAVSGVSKESEHDSDAVSRVDRAYIPSLGLSQKASAAEGAETDVDETYASAAKESLMATLPLERDLGVVSLWPEARKLFGHNTELYCLASTASARSGPKYASSPFSRDVLVASSTKARDVDAAAIRLWDAEKGKCVQVLSGGHRSTVAALCFSPDGRYIASSGKDRRLCLWSRTGDRESEPLFSLGAAVDSAHKRIVWGLYFCPFMPSILASGSRDGFVKIWEVQDEKEIGKVGLVQVLTFEPTTKKGTKTESITSLAFAPARYTAGSAFLALGLECGYIELWAVPVADFGSGKCDMLLCFPPEFCHAATVTKLAWRPLPQQDEDDAHALKLTLASCGADRGCRIFELNCMPTIE